MDKKYNLKTGGDYIIPEHKYIFLKEAQESKLN